MIKRYLVLLTLLACLTGCVPVDSLHPLYTGQDTIYDDALAGEWVSTDKDNPGGLEIAAIVEKGKNTGYTISSLEKDSSGNSKIEYEGRMVSLGGRRFLDIVPQNWDANSYSYVLNVKQSKTGTTIEPRLLRLGTAAYMEFTGGSGEQPLKANLRPAHWFLRVTTDGKKLRLDWMTRSSGRRCRSTRSGLRTHC
jgi:hypothetical protein